MSRVFLQEDHRQKAHHKREAAGIQPEPLPGKAVFMQHRHDIEGQIRPVHQPRPNADGQHVTEMALHIYAQ